MAYDEPTAQHQMKTWQVPQIKVKPVGKVIAQHRFVVNSS